MLDSAETAELLRAVADGESRALQTLLELHRPYLRRVVQMRMAPALSSRLDPSDVVQEAQLVIFKRIDDFMRRRPTSFRLWIRHHTLQCLTEQHRRHVSAKKRSVSRDRALHDASSLAIARKLLSDSPSRVAQRMELRDQIFAAIEQLSENDREVLSLRHAEGLSYVEVSALLNLDPNTVRQRHGRALRRLHEKLSDNEIFLDGAIE